MTYTQSYPRLMVLFVLALSTFLTTPVFATESEYTSSSNTVVDTFTYFGSRYDLRASDMPGIYLDQKGSPWVATSMGALEGQFSMHGPNKPNYIPLQNASPEQITAATTLQGTQIPKIQVDHRGERWFQTVDKEGRDITIRLSEADPTELVKTYGGVDFLGIIPQSAVQLPRENLKFSSALLIVQMSQCFGPGALDPTFTISPITPTCVDSFIHHLMDWKGWVSFYSFMVASRLTTESIMWVLLETARANGDRTKIPMLRAKWMPLLGYIGMAAGSAASQLTSHFLNNPHWKTCINLMATEGLNNQGCVDAFTNFADWDLFWDDFLASTPSLLGSSFLGAVTQKIIVQNYARLTESAAAEALRYKIIGGSQSALRLVARVGPRSVTALKAAFAVTAGVPGVIIFVATEVGQFVLFIAWDEFLRYPTMAAYHDFTKSWSVNDGVEKVKKGTEMAAALNWDKVAIETTCRPPSRAQPTREARCTDEQPLTAGLDIVANDAPRYRNKALMSRLEEGTANWNSKANKFLNKYRLTKFVMEHVYRERQKRPRTSLNIITTAQIIAIQWIEALKMETGPETPGTYELLAEIEILMGSIIENGRSCYVTTEPGFSWSDSLLTELTHFEPARPEDINGNPKLRQALIEFQSRIPRIFYNVLGPILFTDPCNGYPNLCAAHQTTTMIDFNTVPSSDSVDVPPSNGEFLNNILGIFGPELVSETFHELLCNSNSQFEFSNLTDNGWEAHMTAPNALVQREGADQYFRDNCTNRNGDYKYHFDMTDFIKIWRVGTKLYASPLDLLTDSRLPLVGGTTMEEAQSWWHANAFNKSSEFMRNMTVGYHKLLDEQLYSQIPDITPEQLIESSRQAPDSSDNHIVTAHFNMFSRPSTGESLMAQALLSLDMARLHGPGFTGKEEVIAKLESALAHYIIGLDHKVDESALATQWSRYENDIRSAGSDLDAIDEANKRFATTIQEASLSAAKVKAIQENRAEVMDLMAELYKGLANYDYDNLTADQKESYRNYVTLDEARNFSSEEYKKYIFFRLAHESVSKIVIEIDKLYAKLSLQPFTGLPEHTLEY